ACPRSKPSQPDLDRALLLPGDFSEQTTVADLEARFGKKNVKVTDGPDAFEAGAVIYPDDPTRRAYVRFHYSQPLHTLAAITVRDRESRWRGKAGIHVGSSFADLMTVNKARFSFVGFSPDNTATVRDWWNAGALDVAEGEFLYFGVDLRLRPPVEKI